VIDQRASEDPQYVLRRSDLLLLLGAAHAAGCAAARVQFVAIVVEERAAWRGQPSERVVADVCEKLCLELDEAG
jgi:hypothetical protein